VGVLAPDAPSGPAVAGSGPPAPLAAAPGEPRIQPAPDRDGVGALTVLRSPLAALSRVPVTATALTDSPLPKALAAVQRADGPVLVLGPSNDWRAVTGGELTSDAISPDGRRLALRLSDGVRVVDVTTGAAQLLPVPQSATSRIDSIRWMADGEHIAVGGDAGSALLSVADGQLAPLDGLAHEIAVGQSDDPLVRVTQSALVSRSQDGRETRRAYETGKDVELAMWDGTARQASDRVAQTAFLRQDDTQAVAVIDVADGRVTDLLILEYGLPQARRSYGCCETLGWAEERTVLLRDGGSVLAWRPAVGKLYLVAQLPGTATHGADTGSDISVAIAP
jgi:hypothetical protein